MMGFAGRCYYKFNLILVNISDCEKSTDNNTSIGPDSLNENNSINLQSDSSNKLLTKTRII
jgi:hypothetical protein